MLASPIPHFVAVATIVGASLIACSSSLPPPNDAWAAAQADVGRAEAGGAPAVPDARLHLQLAHEDLTRSKALMNNDNERATSLVVLAQSEAQLALSLAKQAYAQNSRPAPPPVDPASVGGK